MPSAVGNVELGERKLGSIERQRSSLKWPQLAPKVVLPLQSAQQWIPSLPTCILGWISSCAPSFGSALCCSRRIWIPALKFPLVLLVLLLCSPSSFQLCSEHAVHGVCSKPKIPQSCK